MVGTFCATCTVTGYPCFLLDLDLSGIVASGKDEVTQDSTNENATQKHVTITEDTISTKSLRCSNSRADRSLVSHNTTIGSSQANVRLSKGKKTCSD